jgi:hypothetical protein
MRSQYALIAEQWPELHQEAVRVERFALGDPRTACFYARRTMELLVEWVYANDSDVDFDQSCIVVRGAKGHKDRTTVLPESLKVPLKTHFRDVWAVHQQDLATTWIRDCSRKRCVPRCKRRGSISRPRATPCAIPLPPTFLPMASTSAPFKSCWGTAM